jgi:hypothetical protein
MGHYASEMPQTEFQQAEAKRFNRMIALKERIGDFSLGSFRVMDLPVLIKIYTTGQTPFDGELTLLEEQIAEIEKKGKQ